MDWSRREEMRLGDDIDDHCSRCKRSTDHSVVAMSGDEVLKTRSCVSKWNIDVRSSDGTGRSTFWATPPEMIWVILKLVTVPVVLTGTPLASQTRNSASTSRSRSKMLEPSGRIGGRIMCPGW